jgi:hypothetical protein
VEVAFNETNSFLLMVTFGIDRSRSKKSGLSPESSEFVIDVVFRSRLSAKAAYNIFIEDLVLAKVLTAEGPEKVKETFL